MRRADPFILCTALAALILAAAPSPARASVVIDDDLSGGLLDPLALAESLAGAGVSVSNASYAGDPTAAGIFSGGFATVGLESGVILSAGRVADVVGPNDAPDTTTSFFTPGDPDLAALAGVSLADTFDAAVLAFDFVPSGDEVTFRYVFVSEEYNEFSNDIFNNVFGFFINGTNYALVPGSGISVSINNVNGGQPDECFNGLDDDLDGRVDAADPDCTTPGDNIVGENNQNSALFINNDCNDPDGGIPCPIDIEADGLTVVLTLTAPVTPNVTNHIKLGIADVLDSVYDSWVFIEEGSFTVVEDCTNGIDDDGDGWIDVADPDCDGDADRILDSEDNCPPGASVDESEPNTFNPDQDDPDLDGFGYVCDSCPNEFNASQPAICTQESETQAEVENDNVFFQEGEVINVKCRYTNTGGVPITIIQPTCGLITFTCAAPDGTAVEPSFELEPAPGIPDDVTTFGPGDFTDQDCDLTREFYDLSAGPNGELVEYTCDCTVKNDFQDPDIDEDGNCTLTPEEGGCTPLDILPAQTSPPFPVKIGGTPTLGAQIDIKPGGCPNAWNRDGRGILPVAIVGGTGDLELGAIDLATVRLSRADQKGVDPADPSDPIGLNVAPTQGPPGPPAASFADVATPFPGGVDDCHALEGDGIVDLLLRFETEAVRDALDMDDFANGALVQLVVSGSLLDGTFFKASGDAVRLVPPGSPPGALAVTSNAPDAWIGASPLDLQLDGGGFATFARTYPQSSVVTLSAPRIQSGRAFRGWRVGGASLVTDLTLSVAVVSEEQTVEAVYGNASGCGLGAELAFLLLPLLWLRGARSRARSFALALVLLLVPTATPAQDLPDTDGDGFPDSVEATGFQLFGDPDPTTGFVESCDGTQPRHTCVDPLTPDLFLIVVREVEPCDPALDPRCIPSGPEATDAISSPTNPEGPGGLGIAVHEIEATQAASNRTVTALADQKAVMIIEDRDPRADKLGNCPLRATPNDAEPCFVFTQKIHDYVMEVCAGARSCRLATDDTSVAADVIRTYVEHTFNHEVGHSVLLSSICTRRYCDHEKAGSGVLMEEASQYTNKGGNVTWYISTQFGGQSQNDAALK